MDDLIKYYQYIQFEINLFRSLLLTTREIVQEISRFKPYVDFAEYSWFSKESVALRLQRSIW